MNVGDLVRLKRPFRPSRLSPEAYKFAVVVGVIPEDSESIVLVHLFDPKTVNIYTDESGARAIYSFQFNEVEYVGDRPADLPDIA
ncbi:MAG: hypothetical protein AAGH78_17760 [Cyanobacteria bacterium P01_H01_bin.58]